jgi:hypothetical protein
MLQNLILQFTSKRKLLKAIKNDQYKNWEIHFNQFNETNSKKADPLKLTFLGFKIYEENLKEIIKDYKITHEESSELHKIQEYFQLPEKKIETIKAKYANGTVTNLSKEKLSDNLLTWDEKKEIEELGKELNLSSEEVHRINQRNAIELYENALRKVVSDNIVSYHEQEHLNALALALGLNKEEISVDKTLGETYQYLVLLNALDHGYLPSVDSPSIVLQRNEIAYWESSANLLVNKVVTTGYTSGSRGVSIRVMKGVSYRVGSSRSQPIKQEVTTRYPGVLVITSKRVVFAASQKSFSIPFSQLISFDPYSDGIGFQKNNKELILQFNNDKISEIVHKILTNALNGN